MWVRRCGYETGGPRLSRPFTQNSRSYRGPIVRSETRICIIRGKFFPPFLPRDTLKPLRGTQKTLKVDVPYIPNTSVCSVTAVGRSVCSVTYAPPHTHSSTLLLSFPLHPHLSSTHLSSASPFLRFLRVRRKQSHPLQAVAQERDPPGRRTPQRHAPRAARVHCVPIPHGYVPFLYITYILNMTYILICPCRICSCRFDYARTVPK